MLNKQAWMRRPATRKPSAVLRGGGHWLSAGMMTLYLVLVLVLVLVLSARAGHAAVTELSKARSDCPETAAEVIVDLDLLEDLLKETKAVGVMTKLKLKGEITKLLKKVDAYHDGKSRLTMAQIREQYDLLYMKVVSLLQGKDDDLHHQLCNSWDQIWSTLEDPEQFKKLSAAERGAYHAYL